MTLETAVSALPTVSGPVTKGLARLGIRTVRDLLYHFPHRHEDRRQVVPVSAAAAGQKVVVQGTLEDVTTEQSFRRYRRGTRPVSIVRARIRDESGSLPVVWYHQRYLVQQHPQGSTVALAGTVNDQGELVAPEIERLRPGKIPLHSGRLVPFYPETAGVTSRQLRYLVARVLPLTSVLHEYLPEPTRAEEELCAFSTAVAELHFPADDASLAAARERLAFDELLLYQLAALVRRAARRKESAAPLAVERPALRDAAAALPFQLTPSQEAALDAILADLGKPVPMARLLAGDVGSGKTVVAGLAALAVARAGGQTALFVPTEILAQQHARTLTGFLGRAGLRIVLLTAAVTGKERATVLAAVEDGSVDLLIGTHAVLHAPVRFRSLALVVVDEQHRFGVLQRGELTRRGPDGTTPHFLSLSATPIPRTLQLTTYGDVDVSPLDPRPGTKPVRTELVPPSRRNAMYASLKNRIATGGQVFVVCPRVAETPEDDRRSVEAEFRRLKHDLFRGLRIGRIHGKLPAEEKERVITAFSAHAIDLLVASTVVEVGVDIPDADTLLIEGAERFGLATLHQLRGRVGRRGQEAACYLATETDTLDALDRLQVLVRTTNGLEIAEEDLRRRGPGELYGRAQHGDIHFKVARLTDLDFLQRVRGAAERLLARDAALATAPALGTRVRQLNVVTHFE